MISLALPLLLALAPARAGVLVLDVEGMGDACCADNVRNALAALPFARSVTADPLTGRACVDLSGPADEAALQAALAAGGYAILASTPAERCPESSARPRSPWEDTGGLDARVISRGEAVSLEQHLAAGKVTLFDFGAPWCPPCWTGAERLKQALAADPGLAVRAIELEGADADASFALPAAEQHLRFAAGLPHFVVKSAKGRTLYQGSDLEAALRAAQEKR